VYVSFSLSLSLSLSLCVCVCVCVFLVCCIQARASVANCLHAIVDENKSHYATENYDKFSGASSVDMYGDTQNRVQSTTWLAVTD
jgi:hypothetical protein